MSTKVRKRVRAHYDQRGTGLRKDVQEAIDRVWPDGIVEMSLDPDESYFSGLHPKLSRALRRIGNLRIPRDGDQRSELMSITIPK